MITCGFFNSVDGDRKYNAEQMNNPYHRIVSNGVFAKPDGSKSDDFKVYGTGTMSVSVNEGDGIFHGKWAKNDSPIIVQLPVPDVSKPRIDSIVFRVDYNTRTGTVELKVGTPAENPTAPLITRTELVMEYRLANILVRANSQGITEAEITDTRAGAECGFVTHLLQQADITATYTQWQAQFEQWFDEIKETLSTATLIRSYTSCYTVIDDETEIPIDISEFNKNLDILQVFKNGLRLLPETEYTVDSDEQITLVESVEAEDRISFVVYKSIDGSDAETVIQEVYELQLKTSRIQLTSDAGGAKYSVPSGQNLLDYFKTLPAGFITLYAPSSAQGLPVSGFAFRLFGHLTVSREDTSIGWLMAYKSDGKVYANYLDTGTWKGWKEVTNSTQITADNGGAQIEVTDSSSVLTAFVNAGIGFHTMYSATGATDTPVNGAFRYFGHITGETTGYIFAMSSAGSVYSNYRNGGVWQGWKVLFEKNQNTLWEGAYFMNENQTVTPSKPLDQCQHGWVLVWSDYDDATSTKNNYNAVTFCVPKKNASGANWNGSSFMCCLPREVKTDGSFVITAKQVYIYNDKITGFAANNANPANRDVILSAVYEY